LGILYLIYAHTSDGQHKKSQQQQCREQHGENNKDAANPPLPPLPTVEQLLAMQAQMVQIMQQTMLNMQAA
jgi:hypothetical protein